MAQALSILMIEDDPKLCEGWTELFDLLGHQVTCHQRGHDALKDLESIHSCDIVITDYYLPDLNGVDLLKQIRDIRNDVPGIVLTGSRESFIIEALNEIPNSTILYKPLNIDDVESAIGEMTP